MCVFSVKKPTKNNKKNKKPPPNKQKTTTTNPPKKPQQNSKPKQPPPPVLRGFTTGPIFMAPLDITLQLICKLLMHIICLGWSFSSHHHLPLVQNQFSFISYLANYLETAFENSGKMWPRVC